MFICYIDESGTPQLTGGTSHFVLLGLAIEGSDWREKDALVEGVKSSHYLSGVEIHTGWMTRRYLEQERIQDVGNMSHADRIAAVNKERKGILLHISAVKGAKALAQTKKNFRKTEAYIHLTRPERLDALAALADLVGGWSDCRLFAEAINKASFSGIPPRYPPFEEAFSQLVSRFEMFLNNPTGLACDRSLGLLVQDNNETVSLRLTGLMRSYHRKGTMWTNIQNIVETPLFVDSSLTSMVQLADLCAYATRRFFEKSETDLFDKIYSRFQRSGTRLVGLRHYNAKGKCGCRVCKEHV